MSTTLLIPASVMRDIREAVFSAMHDASQNVGEPVTLRDHEQHPEWFVEGRKELEHIWAILDIIGWREPDELDRDKYGQIILNAAANHAELYPTWEEEADASDASRSEHGEPPRKEEIFRRGADLRAFIAGLEESLPEEGK
jgi:hypothetical protein